MTSRILVPGVLALCALGFTSCSDDDDDDFEVTTVGASLGGLGLTTLDAAVRAAELDDDLSGPGPFTLFAPLDAAFGLLPAGQLANLLDPANQAQLADLLSYHVLPGTVDAASAAALTGATTLEGSDLIVDSIGGALYLNDARVVRADVVATNGLLHYVDRVLQPPADLVTTLEGRGFTQLVASLDATGLRATLQGPGPFTVLAPTDAAFGAVAGALAGLAPGEVAAILQYHVLPGELRASAALAAGAVPSATGTVVVFSAPQGMPLANGVALTGYNIPCTNGVIHVLDAVLVDPLDLPALAGALGLETLVTALGAAGLDDDLGAPNGPFTVLAPLEAAFAALPAGTLAALLDPLNQADLSELLTYHVLAGERDGATLTPLDAVTTLQGEDLLVDVLDGTLYLNDAAVVAADLQAENGLAHALDTVLQPPQSLVDTLVARGFDTLVQAVVDAGLAGALSAPGPFTVLAPTDAAFAALPAGLLASLSAQELADVLEYHVLAGSVRASAAVALGAAPTLQGPSVLFALEGGQPRVNGVTLSAFNIPCSNGVIHVLDAVLLPPDLPALAENAGLATLLAALQAAGLDDDLAAPSGPFTVFAPSEAAFAAVPADDLAALLEPANAAALQQLLLYHVVPGALDSADVMAATSLTTLEGSQLTVSAAPPQVGGADLTLLDLVASNGIVHVVDALLVPPGFSFPLRASSGPRAAEQGAREGTAPREAATGLAGQQPFASLGGWTRLEALGADPRQPDLAGSGAGLLLVRSRQGALRIDLSAPRAPGAVELRLTGHALDDVDLVLATAPGSLRLELAPDRVVRAHDGALHARWLLAPGTSAKELDLHLTPRGRAVALDSIQVGLR